jgi:hypothetical protein
MNKQEYAQALKAQLSIAMGSAHRRKEVRVFERCRREIRFILHDFAPSGLGRRGWHVPVTHCAIFVTHCTIFVARCTTLLISGLSALNEQ